LSLDAESAVERRLRAHPDAAAAAMVALGLAARLVAARGAVFAPDEALHLRIASASGIGSVYRSSLESAHPPLFLLLLHFWKDLSANPFALRFLPAAFGAAVPWAAYRWAASLFGKTAALATAALLAFLPSLVLLTAELRAYALLLFLMMTSLALLERAFQDESRTHLLAATAVAGLSLLTHFGATWFVLASAGYAATRLRTKRQGPSFVSVWLGAQAALGVLALFLYVSHISRLRGGTLEREAQTDWLQASYFHANGEGAWRFLARQTATVFTFVYSARAAGILGLVFFAGAVAGLAVRLKPAAILLAAPFVLSAAAGLLAIYPYGGTRHSAHLFPFVCAGAGVALARLSGERWWVAYALAAALLPAAFAVGG
jgi:uncharacterized membrane protein